MNLSNIPIVSLENIIQNLDIDSFRNLLLVNKEINSLIINVLGTRIITLRNIELSMKNERTQKFLNKMIMPKIEDIILNIYNEFHSNLNKINHDESINILYDNIYDNDFKIITYFETISNNSWNKLCKQHNKNTQNQYKYGENCIKSCLSCYESITNTRKQNFDNTIYSTEKYTFFLLMYLYLFH
tara:strand:+ start:8696 stop:9250 length:555 start_codon:yes stop_codon:yes gene_type:complete